MRAEGIEVRTPDQVDESLPALKIGFLNIMPDAALAATERQFLRLLAANSRVNCYFYPFNIEGVERSEKAQAHVDQFYCDFKELKSIDVDALVITGANVSKSVLQDELFWSELTEVLEWAKINIRSTLCSCLATHAAVKVYYDIDRKHLGDKCWGVFDHGMPKANHLLLKNVEDTVLMCHSRFNDISEEKFANNNIDVLVDSQQVGVQLASEKDMRTVYFQGHPEYDDISLLKEYKREIIRYLSEEREEYPPVPENYFNKVALEVINQYKQLVQSSDKKIDLLDMFPEDKLKQSIDNPWKKSAQTIFSNWMGWLAR